jgi:hypothetical protein
MINVNRFEQQEAVRNKQLLTGSLLTTKMDNDTVMYRGHKICKRNTIPVGYWGRYRVYLLDNKTESFAKLSECKIFINNLF